MFRILTVVLFGLLPTQSVFAAGRPNILVRLTDDQRWDSLGCLGHPFLKTPNIDRIAEQGVTFKNAFVTTSICCVSRASFLTGRYARNHRVGDFSTPLPTEILSKTYPAVAKRAGYRTGCFGKWGIGGQEPKEVFDVWDAWGGQGEYFHMLNGKKVHNSEFLALKAEEFLRSCKSDQPFCLLVYYKSPHEPFLPDPRDADLFRDVAITPPKTYTDAYFQSLPDFIRNSEGRTRLNKRHPTPEKYQEFVKQYLGCVAGVDRSVGRILQTLDDLKLTDDTIVVYTSDNGFMLGDHGLSGKWLMYEESIRVPLLIRGPMLPAAMKGTASERLALNIDLSPTVLDLAGLKIPAGTDGQSLRPLLEGRQAEWRSDFFYEHHFDFGGRIPRTEGVRSADWKYITYPAATPKFEELYDLRNDPLEEHNLAGDGKHRRQLEAMQNRYQDYVRKLPPPVLPTPAPPPKKKAPK